MGNLDIPGSSGNAAELEAVPLMHHLSITITEWGEQCPFQMVPRSDLSYLEVHGQLRFAFGTCPPMMPKGCRKQTRTWIHVYSLSI